MRGDRYMKNTLQLHSDVRAMIINTDTAKLNVVIDKVIKRWSKGKNFVCKIKSSKTRNNFCSYLFSYDYITEYFKFYLRKQLSDDEKIIKGHVVRGMLISYSWMPTTLALNNRLVTAMYAKCESNNGKEEKENNSASCELQMMNNYWNGTNERLEELTRNLIGLAKLDRSKEEDVQKSLSDGFLNNLVLMMNNSISGASKFLHFFDPEVFPIYDSTVRGVLGKSLKAKCERSDLEQESAEYIEYLRLLCKLREKLGKEDCDRLINAVEDAYDLKNGEKISFVRAIDLIIFASSKAI